MILKEQHKLPFRVDRFADVPMLVGRFLKHSKGFQCFNMKHVMIFHRPGGASTVSTRKAEARPLERCEKIPDGDTTPKRTTMCVFFFRIIHNQDKVRSFSEQNLDWSPNL